MEVKRIGGGGHAEGRLLRVPKIGMGPAGVTLSWNELCPGEEECYYLHVEMQVNMEFEFMFIAFDDVGNREPPQPTRSALPPLEAMACHAAVWSKCE
jgi:hypothetical protein